MRTVAMTPERLAELEAWARAWSRCETVAARNVLELVAEVQRLKVAAALETMLAPYYPAAVPPFRGILDGITAADVFGVQV